MHEINFVNKKGELKSKIRINPDLPYEQILKKLNINSKFIFHKNLLYEHHIQWNNLESQEEFKEQFYKSYKNGNGYKIDLLIYSSQPTHLEEYCDEKLEKLLGTLDAYKFKFCIFEVTSCYEYLYELFCKFNTKNKDFRDLSKDELYYLALYYSFQLFKQKQRIFIKLKREVDPMFSEEEIEKTKAIEFIKRIGIVLCEEENNHFRGFYLLASFYRGIAKNYDVMELYYMEAIKRGDFVNSLNNLALYYKDSTKKFEKMKAIYEVGIKIGNFKSMNQLAIYYTEIESDTKKMLHYFDMAQKCGSVYAVYGVGHYFYFRIQKNYDKMKELYLKAIEYGIPNAMNDLAFYYETVCNDYEKMEYYYKMAVEKYEFLYSMNNLGVYYKNIKKDYEEMKKYLIMGIERGCRYSMYSFALYFHKIVKNEEIMIKYYKLSYKSGYKQAYYMLGLYFQYDKRNYDEMKNYYEVNILENKCTRSMIKYAVYYFDIENNRDEAKKYLKMAIKHRNHMGYHYLGLISGIEKKDKEMIENYENAISKGKISESMHNLAEYYAKQKNSKFVDYFVMSIERGNKKSLERLIEYQYVGEKAYLEKTNTNETMKELKSKFSDSSLLWENIVATSKLLYLLKHKFGDYNFRMFVVNYYIRKTEQSAIEFLKNYISVNRLDPLVFEEYRTYRESKFKSELFSNSYSGDLVKLNFVSS